VRCRQGQSNSPKAERLDQRDAAHYTREVAGRRP
jgi:hypothetical protein